MVHIASFVSFYDFPDSLGRDVKNSTYFPQAKISMCLVVLYKQAIAVEFSEFVVFSHKLTLAYFNKVVKGFAMYISRQYRPAKLNLRRIVPDTDSLPALITHFLDSD